MSVPVYPSIKDSEVEWLRDVPSHWPVLPGRRIFRQIREASREGDEQLSASQKYGIIPQAQLMAMEDQKVVLALKGLDGFKHVEADDFVISLRSFQGGIEHSAYRGCVSPAYTILRPTVAQLSRYYYYTLKCAPYIAALQSVTDGIRDGKNISFEQFGVVGLPTPPVDEQAAIAAFLDRETAKIDGLVEEQRRLIALLKEKRQAVISHAVTKGLSPDAPMKDSGIEWLGEVPAHWDRVQLGRLCKQVSDGPHFSPPYVDEGFMFLSARNIRVDGWSFDDAKYINQALFDEFCKRVVPERGDVLYTKGGTTGIARVVDFDRPFQVWVHVAVLKIITELSLPEYVAYALNSSGCYEQSQLHTRGATNQDLGLTRMIKIWLALPPLDEQHSIVIALNAELYGLDAALSAAAKLVELLQERRAALISAAVTGKIDVRGLVATAAEMEAA